MRGGVGNPSLPACCLKRPVRSAPDETITILFWASVLVAVSDPLEAKLPTLAVPTITAWLFDFVVDFN